MIVKNSMKLVWAAGWALVAGAVGADESDSSEAASASKITETFESYTETTLDELAISGWAGDGTVTALAEAGSSASATAGSPTETESAKYLAIAGEVTCTPTLTATQTAQADFLVKITEASDSLETLADADVQIAVAAGTTETDGKLPICVYCRKASGETAEWVTTGTMVATDSWVRVTLTFDYANSRCRVVVDGLPVVASEGYVSPTAEDTTAGPGSWFRLVTDKTTPTAVAEVKFIGSTAIDDFNVAQEAVSAKEVEINLPDSAKTTIAGFEVANTNLVKWGVTAETAETVSVDGSGLTVAQKLVCGLEPDDGEKFQLTKLAAAADGKVKVRFPGTADGSRYTVSVYDNAEGTGTALASVTGEGIGNAEDGGKEATVDLSGISSEKKVLFFKVKASTN